ncbi:MAG: zinc metalloprotease [Cyclobacteriaceae bacterium]|nr:MAG: zinc metalloprotease [Cyclobacteriaceae bacterium]
MDWIISLAQLLLSISILVAVHEMGHLLAAKYFGMRVEQFSIGFPPKLWSFRRGETEYAISAIPLGGYVKIAGMIDESLDSEALKAEPQPWEFRAKPAWQRLIVMLGGITVNVLVGILIFIGITWYYGDTWLKKDAINNNGGFVVGPAGERIGLQTGDKIIKINGRDYSYFQELVEPANLLADNASYTVLRNGEEVVIPIPPDFIQTFNRREGLNEFVWYRIPAVVGEVVPGTIASRVGLQPGDRILEVNGTPVKYHDEVLPLVRQRSDSVRFTVERNGVRFTYAEKFTDKPAIGFYARIPEEFIRAAEEKISYGFLQSVPLGTERAFTTLAVQVRAFGKMLSGVLSPRESLSGPIGIMQAFGPRWDWERFWSLTGVLSLVLAFMNLLPIPALDGGHVMFLGWEIIAQRKPSDKILERAQRAGMLFLLLLMVLIFANDIMKLVNL